MEVEITPGACQRGVALISILLLLSVLATLAIYAAENQDLAIRRASNLDAAEQGYQVNLSGEQWVVKVLEKDLIDDKLRSNESDPPVDHAGEIWGNLGPPVEVGETGTTLLMLIEDLQGRLNVNNLVQGKQPQRNRNPQNPGGDESGEGENDPVQDDSAQNAALPPEDGPEPILWFQIFQRLFASHELNPELVDAIIDWVDADQDPIGTTGAEDLFYTGLELPYRSANRLMVSTAELESVKDFNSAGLEKILPFLSTLPITQRGNFTRVNVNTAPAQILSLFAADPVLDPDNLIPLIERREAKPFPTVAEFESEFDTLVAGGLAEGAREMLTTTSDYYAGRSCAQSGRVKFSMSSLLKKQNKAENVKVLQRERYFGCPAFPAVVDGGGRANQNTAVDPEKNDT